MEKSIHSEGYTAFLRILRETRERANLSQEQLADLLGETQSFVSKCERGERRLDLVEARAFSAACGLPFPEFIELFEKEIRESK